MARGTGARFPRDQAQEAGYRRFFRICGHLCFRREPAQWENGSLVRRFTFILWFYKAKLIVEYREPLPAPSDMPLEDNIPLLTAFEARALESFRLLNGDPKNGGVELPRPKEKLPYPPAGINRQALTDFIGTLWDMKK